MNCPSLISQLVFLSQKKTFFWHSFESLQRGDLPEKSLSGLKCWALMVWVWATDRPTRTAWPWEFAEMMFFWTWHIFEGRNTPVEGKHVVLLQQPSPNQSKTFEMLDTRRRVSLLFRQELSKVVSPVRAELKAGKFPSVHDGCWGDRVSGPIGTVWCVPGGTCTRQWPLTIGGAYTREVDQLETPQWSHQRSKKVAWFQCFSCTSKVLKHVKKPFTFLYSPWLSYHGCHSYYAYFL